jgi:hypothetical protein
MTVFTVVLYLHIVATMALAAAFGVEIYVVRAGIDAAPRLRTIAIAPLAALMLSGGYLTVRMSAWALTWAQLAVTSMFGFGALTGVSFRRMAGVPSAAKDPMVRRSQSLRLGVLLGIVLLMTARPGAVESFAIFAASLVIGVAVSRLRFV